MSIIAQNIKTLRLHLKMKRPEFADLFNTTHMVIESYENGRAKPKAELAAKICDKFGLSNEQLFNEIISPSQLQEHVKPSENTLVHIKLKAAEQRISDLEKTIADKDKIIALLEKLR